MKPLCVLTALTLMLGCQGQTPSQTYAYVRQLDTAGNVFLYWEFNTTHITLELHGRTTGWVGFGISPGGGMTGADIVVGWVKSGQVTITDRHALSNSFPPLDSEENIDDKSGGESDGWTWMKFTRQFPTCAATQDLAITDNTMKIIYAYGSNDPTGDDIVSGDYHGTNRGSRDIIFTQSASSSSVAPPSGETVNTFTLTTGGITIPAQDTYYSCHLLQFPEVTSKRHIVKISPVIQSGNELYVHHVVVYQCVDPLPVGVTVGSMGQCYTDSAPIAPHLCAHVITAWAVGGEDIEFPTNVGFPFGEAGDPNYVVIEMHYDNPNQVAGVVDDSGLRFSYTSQLRTHDAGTLQAGQIVDPFLHVIPPRATSFLTYGDCPGDCLDKAMAAATDVTSINIFSVMLHTHLLGKKITLRHIRNGVEQPFIAKDEAYNFNFQTYRYVSPERNVLPGDNLQVLCDYDSSAKTSFTYGGLSTDREMCLAFITYYPRIPISICESGVILDPYWYNVSGLTTDQVNDLHTPSVPSPGVYNSWADYVFQSTGQTMDEYLNAFNWNQTSAAQYSSVINLIPKIQRCHRNGESPSGLADYVLALRVTQPYAEVSGTCVATTTTTTTTTTTSTTASTTTTTTTTSGQTGQAKMKPTYMLVLLVLLYVIIGV